MEMEENSPHESEESENRRWRNLYDGMGFMGDLHERTFFDVDNFRNMGVYAKVHRNEACGHKIIATRWAETNKGVGEQVDNRSGQVGRELNCDLKNAQFAPTPRLEARKALVSLDAISHDQNAIQMRCY